MVHLWVRAEQRAHEERVGLTPEGAAALVKAGIRVTVEASSVRAIGIDGYRAAGCEIGVENSWPDAPADAIVFGLKELPEDGTPLQHRHIMFGHAYKGQPAGRELLKRFKAGYAGAAVSLKCWAAQQRGGICGPVTRYDGKAALLDSLAGEFAGLGRPRAIIIGALGRVGTGAADCLTAMGVQVTRWDMAETASGGPFPEVLSHEIFLNCILARPGCPVFVPASALGADRALTVIGDIACDPTSDFSPIKVYDRATDWDAPALRVWDAPPLDVTAIDNLPSMLPVESSQDYAGQLLASLLTLGALGDGVWGRARVEFDRHVATV